LASFASATALDLRAGHCVNRSSDWLGKNRHHITQAAQLNLANLAQTHVFIEADVGAFSTYSNLVVSKVNL